MELNDSYTWRKIFVHIARSNFADLFAVYWNFWPDAHDILKLLEDNLNGRYDNEISEELVRRRMNVYKTFPVTLSTDPYIYGNLFMQSWEGYKGWRLIITTSKNGWMKATINFVLEESFIKYFKQEKSQPMKGKDFFDI